MNFLTKSYFSKVVLRFLDEKFMYLSLPPPILTHKNVFLEVDGVL